MLEIAGHCPLLLRHREAGDTRCQTLLVVVAVAVPVLLVMSARLRAICRLQPKPGECAPALLGLQLDQHPVGYHGGRTRVATRIDTAQTTM